MRWEFFFYDHDVARLEAIEPVLLDLGYIDIEVLGPSRDDDDHDSWYLQAVKIEQLSAQELYVRCVQLSNLARKYGVEEFDGFNVANIDEAQPLY